KWLRLIRYTSGAIVARSARPCGVLLPHLLLGGAQDGLDELPAVPDLHGGALDLDVHPASRTVLAAADLLPGDRDDPVGGDPTGDPPLAGSLEKRRGVGGSTNVLGDEPGGRGGHAEGRVGPLGVVAPHPGVELGLGRG